MAKLPFSDGFPWIRQLYFTWPRLQCITRTGAVLYAGLEFFFAAWFTRAKADGFVEFCPRLVEIDEFCGTLPHTHFLPIFAIQVDFAMLQKAGLEVEDVQKRFVPGTIDCLLADRDASIS